MIPLRIDIAALPQKKGERDVWVQELYIDGKW